MIFFSLSACAFKECWKKWNTTFHLLNKNIKSQIPHSYILNACSDALPTTSLLYTAQLFYDIHRYNSRVPSRCTLSNLTNTRHLRDLLDSDGKFEEVRRKLHISIHLWHRKKLSLGVMRLSTEKTKNGRITVVCLTLICHSDATVILLDKIYI